MKQHFAYSLRTRFAGWAMRQTTALVALVAPWLARPGDPRMSGSTLIVVLVMLALALTVGVLGTSMTIRATLFPHEREETAP